MISEVENLLLDLEKSCTDNENSTSCQCGEKLKVSNKLSEKYGLSKRLISRYLRINKLIFHLKELLDEKKLNFMSCVTISFLTEDEQNILYELILEHECLINTKKAEQLKELSNKKEFTIDTASEIILGTKKLKSVKKLSILKLKRKTFSTFFDENKSQEQIEQTILKALEFYFENQEYEQLEKGEDEYDVSMED